MNTCSFFLLLCPLLFSQTEATLFGCGLLQCQFSSSGDVVYLAKMFFNKLLWADYNSTLGKYTGYTEKAIEVVDGFNKNKEFLKREQNNLELCKTHVQLVLDVLSKSAVEPSVTLRSADLSGSRHPSMLVCSAYNFYPKQIRLSWLRNGKEVTSDVMSTEELPSGNWLYQIHSHLELTHTSGDTIACQVEHASLLKPKLYEWESISESERNKFAVGAAALLLGLVVLGGGLIYNKRCTNGRQLVPTSAG
ncbi:rano class II histocompatibility antigen%2C A beta chain-like [Xyrichtys novacula]|uniref:Rano class II histocompatibility antigen, A beta chain-like n=1 Tax=Xyrichtys novacula TaxID=13765 RepID=A0AAV1FLX1_XYRNO|nr:rano class II histocompatibility antigen%2C A beta chain-like [Xyrichtys novacula]